MKHKIRQCVLDPVTGLKVTKVETVTGELGSGVEDVNGNEIYEGDVVKAENDDVGFYKSDIRFEAGRFHFGIFSLTDFNPGELEIIGHVN